MKDAPERGGSISRDRFILLYAVMTASVLQSQGNCKGAKSLIGSPDAVVAMTATADGLQISATENGATQRFTKTWADF